MTATGMCECGAVRYEIADETVIHPYACHCLNCQTRSGSAFAEHVLLPASLFKCEGETLSYMHTYDGITFDVRSCARCHTRLFNSNSAVPDMVFLKAGTLAESHMLEPKIHIWTSRKQRWVSLPDDAVTFAESPTPEEFGAAVEATRPR